MKLRSVQILRGVAASGVLVHHAFPGRATPGAAGVDLFFVISGFIMATYGLGRSPAQFLADRAWRIYPLWLLALAPWIWMVPQTPIELVRDVTLWPVYGERFVNPALGVGWTLSFELIFYLAFALALASRNAVPLAVYTVCLVLGLTTQHVIFWFLGSPLALEFLLGTFIVQLPRSKPVAIALFTLAALWFFLAPDVYRDQAFGEGAIYRVIAYGIPAAMIFYSVLSFENRLGDPLFAVPELVGSASYSIYLFHRIVLLRFEGLTGLVLSMVGGILVYLAVERPITVAVSRWRRVPNKMASASVGGTDELLDGSIQRSASASLRT